MEAASSAKTMELVYQYSLCGIPEDRNLHQNHSENQHKLIFINVFLTGVHESQMTKFCKVAVNILVSLVWNLMSTFLQPNFDIPTIYLENLRTLELHHLLLME
jgi:hypothetical protein